MTLTNIEALRYGALENGCLADLGAGLTVVLGPNESGKSTFTALTRHVLYGYPYANAKENGYLPPSGGRAARLVFSDSAGTWAIERTEGPKRGPYKVIALSGPERPGLLDEIVGGVSEQTFRVVFGFGLDELAQIGSAESAGVVARLYAAGTGLEVNPIDVRRQVEALASEIYSPRASKPQLNALAASIKSLREHIRALESEAASYAAEQLRLNELSERLLPLKQQRDEADSAARALARDLQQVQAVAKQMADVRDSVAELDKSIGDARRSAELIDVDERLLAAGPALNSVLDETSGFRARVDALAVADADATSVDRTIAALPAVPETIADSAEDRAAVERWRDQLSDARRVSDSENRSAQQAEARAQQAAQLEQEQHQGDARTRRPLAAGIAAVVVGVGSAVAGVLTAQWIATGLGALVVVAGALLLVRRPVASSPVASLSAESARLKTEALAQRQVATEAADTVQRLESEWKSWLEARGLVDWGEDPVAVRELLAAAQERRRLAATRDAHLATATRERTAAEAWVVRLVDVVKSFDDTAGQIPTLTGALELAARARASLERAHSVRDDRSQLLARIHSFEAEKSAAQVQLEQLQSVLGEIANARGLDSADTLAQLEDKSALIEEELAEVRRTYEALADEVAGLRGRLDDEGRDDRMARARQELEGLRTEAVKAAERYTVLALSVRLLDRARERFEAERQPEVVRTAARVFSAMTSGRYRDVRVPLDGTGISVISEQGVVRSSEELSRGTAEQLYLALRVGLIGSLGEMGKMLPILMDDVVVNFDPERRSGSALAVGELARMRQVIFFTCHPETAELLQREVAGSTLVTLDRCALRP